MSWSIDPRRPYRLEDTCCVNKIPFVRALQNRVSERKQYRDKMKRAFKKAEQDFQQNFGNYCMHITTKLRSYRLPLDKHLTV